MNLKFLISKDIVKYLFVNLNSVFVKTLGFFVFLVFIKTNWFGKLIYTSSLMLILTSFFSALILVPALEKKLKFKYVKTAYLVTFLLVVLFSNLVSENLDLTFYTIALTSLNYMVDINKKIYNSNNKILFKHELISIFLYILYFVIIYIEKPLLLILLILPILIISFKSLNKLQGNYSNLLTNFNYSKSSIWLTILSFISSNFIFVYINGLIPPDVFNTINSYRVLFNPIGVVCGFIENKIMTLKKMFFKIPLFIFFIVPFVLLFLFVSPGIYAFVIMGVIASIYMSLIRLNNMYFRKSFLDKIIIKFSIINLIFIIIFDLLIIEFFSAYYIYFANILSLTLVQWNYQKKIEE